MTPTPTEAIKIFYCYAHEDKLLRDELGKQLVSLKRSGQVTDWYDREILPGTEWKLEIDAHINTADIVLLLISVDFMASDYCYEIEMQKALKRQREEKCRVIPVILRPTYLPEDEYINDLQQLPTDGRDIKSWLDRDAAFKDVISGIHKVIKEMRETKKDQIQEVEIESARRAESKVEIEHARRAESKVEIEHAERIENERQKTQREDMDRLIQQYKKIRYEISPGWEKTRNMENVMMSMQDQAQQVGYTRQEIISFLLSYDEGKRLAGLAILQWLKDIGIQNVNYFEQALKLMNEPRSPFEHYHTLEMLKAMWPYLDPTQQEALRKDVHNHTPGWHDNNSNTSKEWHEFYQWINTQ